MAGRKRDDGRGLERRLAAVQDLAARAPDDEVLTALRAALADPSNLVVAAAAEIIGRAQMEGFVQTLGAAFDRLIEDPLERDKTCRGKTAAVRALLDLGEPETRIFLAALRHEQWEPAWGPPVDTAVELRGLGALGLVRARHPDAPWLLAERLHDGSHVTRAIVARALAEVEQGAAVPLLRFKIAVGDQDPGVIGACFSALLAHVPAAALDLAAAYLRAHDDEAGEAVALALGESRRREAFDILKAWAAEAQQARQVAFLAMALVRSDPALDHLLAVITQGPRGDAEHAVRALAHFRHDDKLVSRIRAAVATRADVRLSALADTALAG